MNSNISDSDHDEEKPFLLPRPVTSKASLMESAAILNAFWVFVNGLATVVVVFLNKTIFSEAQLRGLQITTAIWHLAATFIILYIASLRPFRLMTASRLPVLQMLPICILFAGFLVLNNLSLTYNPISNFQLAKIMTVPCVVFINFVLFHKHVSRAKILSVVVACLGVALATGASTGSNALGSVLAVFAFTVTALYQVWIAKSLSDQEVSPPQLLLNQAPICIMMLVIMVPFLDTTPQDLESIPIGAVICFVCSGFVAALINLSQFLIIGRTSALTFNVVGIMKTVTVLVIGWILEGKHFNYTDVVGVALALGGSFMYSQSKKE